MSWFGGKPVELYKFTRGSESWFVATGKKDVIAFGDTYATDFIERENIRSTGDKGREQINITMNAQHPVVSVYAGGSPAFPTNLTILRADDETVDTFRYVWTGRIVTCEFQASSKAKLAAQPISTTLKRLGLRRPYQTLCPLVLYDPDTCRATKVAYAGTVIWISGPEVSVSFSGISILNGIFPGGNLIFGQEIFFILDQAQSVTFTTVSDPHVSVGDSILLVKFFTNYPATVTAVSGNQVTAALTNAVVGAGAFTGALMLSGVLLPIEIVSQDAQATTLTLSVSPLDLSVSDAVSATRGCSHDVVGCKSFSNLDNYGGYPYMPQRNPFGLNPII